ncbi:MAG: fibrillarin-like rRNA/tRNA 2'-O-methyltransferase, partial [Nitrososphaeraceae archaeon]|nr:fibrillarin-like rRNA/tRNA 2'-O-methyltransferase [Nitrososphaeraceae archaeon]
MLDNNNLDNLAYKKNDARDFDGYIWININGEKQLATLNLVKGNNVYGEKLILYKKEEYRLWDPFRSKLAASLLKGLQDFPIKKGLKILYLGASTGTTISHI